MSTDLPPRFLHPLLEQSEPDHVLALCANYEQGRWRAEGLAAHLIEWLPEFALPWSERQAFSTATGVRQLRRAATVVYTSDKYQKRGEFGELILHAVLRDFYGTEPAVAKLFYKSAMNDTVKGFDAVHIVAAPDGLELWLGEAKFYRDLNAAIRDVVEELHTHFADEYLRDEFLLITNKMDPAWPYATALSAFLDRNTTLDDILPRVRVPVLLTHDSPVLQAHASRSDEYTVAFREEAEAASERFRTAAPPDGLQTRLVLLPLGTKEDLLDSLHSRLQHAQAL